MFKLLISLFILVPSIVFASLKENKLYLYVSLAGNKINSVKQDSYISPEIGMGVGYYIDDFYRADITATTFNFNFYDSFIGINKDDIIGTNDIKSKAYGHSLMFNNYFNIKSADSFKIFIGAGLGVARIKEQRIYLFSGNIISDQIFNLPLLTETYTSKTTTNFAYSLSLGTSINIKPRVNLDLIYSYKDFGKPKYRIVDLEKVTSVKSIKRYTGHQLSVGLRFDL